MSQDKLDKLTDDMTDLKVIITRQEANMENMAKILERLTASVEEHVDRSNKFETGLSLLRQKVDNNESKLPLVLSVISAIGAAFLFLKQLGILDKLL